MRCLNPIDAWKSRELSDKGKRLITLSPRNALFGGLPDFQLPCGKCPACLANRRRDWRNRLRLEHMANSAATFVTLTYDDSHIPFDRLPRKEHIQKFLKRLRNVSRDYGISVPKFRYYFCSEFGGKTHRPHYHGIIYGIDMLGAFGNPWQVGLATFSDGFPVYNSKILERVWPFGFNSVDFVNFKSIRYVSSYICTDDSPWHIQSQGLGRSFFCKVQGRSAVGVKPALFQSVSSGFVPMPNNGFGDIKPVYISKLADRYLERFSPDCYAALKTARLFFISNSVQDNSSDADILGHLQNERRILNERKLHSA